MEFDISKVVEKIAMQSQENQEEFIFETIHPYCENILQMKINKEELKQILLNGIQKQQPCEDCISRKEAINVVHYYFQHYLDVNDDICLDGIRTLPSVTPQRKRGKWIEVEILDSALWHECSECGETEFYATDYCPNCGAKMDADMRGDSE